MNVKVAFPLGGPFSPITDPKILREREHLIYKENLTLPLGIHFNDELHVDLLLKFKDYIKDWSFTTEKVNDKTYYTNK